MRSQEVVIEIERAPVLQRIYNKRRASGSINYKVLGDDGDAKDLRLTSCFGTIVHYRPDSLPPHA